MLHVIRLTVRTKYDANVKLSDRELFDSMTSTDLWEDADLVSVFVYLIEHPRTSIPDSWLETMGRFKEDLLASTCNQELLKEYNSFVAQNY